MPEYLLSSSESRKESYIASYIHTRAINTYNRALFIYNRGLYIYKRAIHSRKGRMLHCRILSDIDRYMCGDWKIHSECISYPILCVISDPYGNVWIWYCRTLSDADTRYKELIHKRVWYCLNIHKRALYIYKRALYVCKRALHPQQSRICRSL